MKCFWKNAVARIEKCFFWFKIFILGFQCAQIQKVD